MNTPNKLTVLRIILSPISMLIFSMNSFAMCLIGLVLFIVAALTDMADGYYARKYGITTGFGKFMDPLADKVLVSSAMLLFIARDMVSPIPVILIIGREFLVTGLRALSAYRQVMISPTWAAKTKTFLQMTVVALLLAWVFLETTFHHFGVEPEFMTRIDSRFWFNLLIWLTAVITVWTGIDYYIKYSYMIKTALK